MTQKFDYKSDFAQSYDEAVKRFKLAYADDPFEDIDASLLNSANIQDYAKQVGLIYPFNAGDDGKNLKTASYGAHVGDKVVLWPPENKQGKFQKLKDSFTGITKKKAEKIIESVTVDLTKKHGIKIPPFSLVFIQTQETFLLPLYLAARFNLRINLVHKGLLLGTGPIVDPGFHGKLLIPLHNLTSNTYELRQGDKLIWVEFTKTIMHESWRKTSGKEDRENYTFASPGDFEEAKLLLEPAKYLETAMMDSSEKFHQFTEIKSGIPDSLSRFQETADKAANAVASLSRFSTLAFYGAIIGLIGLFFQWSQIKKDHEVRWTQTQKEISDLNSKISSQDANESKIEVLEREIKRLEDIVFDMAIDTDSTLPEVENDGKAPPQKR